MLDEFQGVKSNSFTVKGKKVTEIPLAFRIKGSVIQNLQQFFDTKFNPKKKLKLQMALEISTNDINCCQLINML